MRKKQKLFLSVFMVLSMITANFTVCAEGEMSVIYVSPNGNDLASGREYDPLKTLDGARDKLRELKKESKLSDKGVTILFREGEYSWHEQVSFNAQDSGTADAPVIYASYPGERVSFTGGIKIDAFEDISDKEILSRFGENAKNIKQLDLNSIFNENSSIVSENNVYAFDGEQEMWLARFPNKSGGAYEDINPLTVFWKTRVDENMDIDQFSYSGLDSNIKAKISRYAENSDIRVYGNLVYAFWDNDYPVSIDSDNEIITVKNIANTLDTEEEQRIKNNMPFFLYNIPEELDRNGEYYIKDGIMYIYRDNFDDVKMNIAMYDGDYMISTNNASYITFRGIIFENTKGSAAYIQGGENICFDSCTFENIGKSAVKLGKSQGNYFHRPASNELNYTEWSQQRYDMFCGENYSIDVTGKNHGLDSCLIRNTGEAAVVLSGGNPYRDEECGYFVKNCRIEFAGLHERTYTGAIKINYSHGIYLENNTLAHIPGAIINGSVYKMLVKNNDIYDGMTESYDNALVYLNYQSPVLDIKFDGNYFHDVRSDVPLTRNRLWPGPQVGAVAFDNSPMGGGYEYTNNVFENLPYGIWYVNGTKAENNVFFNCYNPIKGGGGKLEVNDPVSNKPLRASWQGIFNNRETSFRDGLTAEEKRIVYLSYVKAKEENLLSDPTYKNRSSLVGYENLLSLPVFIGKNAGYDDVYLFGHLFYLFYHDEAKIKINAQDQTITTVGNLPLGIKSNMDYFIFNILDELDAPGEYYVDKATGMMYVYPNGDITQKTMNVSLLDKKWMIEMDGTSNVTFSGLTFENSKGGGIYTGGGSNVRFEYCSFNNFGTMGVQIGKTEGLPYSDIGQALSWLDTYGKETGDDWWQKQYNFWMKDEHQIVGKNNGLYGCVINNTGNSAVLLAGGNLYKGEQANHYVEECIIENVANYKRTYAAAINVRGCGFNIKNNRLGHCPASLINGNTSIMLVEGNELYDGMSESNDNALIYLNFQYPNLDVKFIDNYFHDTVPEHEIKSSSSMFSQRSAIAFDNSYGGGVEFTNNVFANIPRGNFLKDNEKLNNNVYVDCFTPIQIASGVTGTDIIIPNPISEETVAPLHQYTQFFLSWPIFAGGELGEKVNKEWREKYPVLMDWVDIVKSGAAEGKNYYEAKNNLIVNKSMPLHQAVTKLSEDNKYQASMRHEISNNVYTDNTSMFVDYANRNYQLTPEASAQYGNTLNLSTVGPKTTMIGANKFADAKISLPTAQGGTVNIPTVEIPSQVKGAVVLKIGASDAFANDKKVKVDPANAAVMPQIINDRTLVPARFISESFGGEVGWDDASRTVTIKLGEKTVKMVLDKNELMIDDAVAAVMDVPAQSIEGRTMVPLRALCETALSKKVFWDPKGLIVISDKDNILNSTSDAGVIDQILNSLK